MQLHEGVEPCKNEGPSVFSGRETTIFAIFHQAGQSQRKAQRLPKIDRRRPRGCPDHQRTGRRLRPSRFCYLERPNPWMNRSTSRASTPPAIAAVVNCERDFRWTTVNRPDRLGEAPMHESIGAAMDGRTVFPALASTNHRSEFVRWQEEVYLQALLIARHTVQVQQNSGLGYVRSGTFGDIQPATPILTYH